MDKKQIVALLRGIIAAVEAGQVAAEKLEGRTLAEMAQVSEEGWDKFDEIVARGQRAGHEDPA